jgi:hypothetical protein
MPDNPKDLITHLSGILRCVEIFYVHPRFHQIIFELVQFLEGKEWSFLGYCGRNCSGRFLT